MEKILYLHIYGENEWFNDERNKYSHVDAKTIFKSKSLFSKLVRNVFKKLKLPMISMFFSDWKYDIKNYNSVVILVNKYSSEVCRYINKKSNCKIIHWYWNSIEKDFDPNLIKNDYSQIWSFDEADCDLYGINKINQYYFKTFKLPDYNIINDVYFVGGDKGRLRNLIELERVLNNAGLRTNFHITKTEESSDDQYKFEREISYEEVLKGIAKSKVILDYNQECQNGLTLRPLESIFHSKKLITNNYNIKKYDFYNKNNIFILGEDDLETINQFVNSPYVDIDSKIIEKYDFGNWIKEITLENKNE